MPPAYLGHDKLPEAQIDLMRRWIEQGASYEPHWSLIAPKRLPAPRVSNPSWPRNPIDAFVLARLDREGLRPSPEADRTTLLRRVTLDLTGLPPTPAEIEAFLNDSSRNAYEKVVDRLLASPRYAERMAIRWLEAARYADTNGYQTDGPRDMWRWRDWVIDAFHRNMPFDRFTIEQIAGDLLPNATLAQQIATAFHRNHRTTAEGGIVDEEFRVEYVADRAETTATVWLGLTVGCARCHDHKYDPITQKEFYQLFAFFNNVPERGFVYNFGNEEPFIKAPLPEQQRSLDEFDRKIAAARSRLASLDGKSRKAEREWVRRAATEAVDWNVTEGQTSTIRSKERGSTEKSTSRPARMSRNSTTATRSPSRRGSSPNRSTARSSPGRGLLGRAGARALRDRRQDSPARHLSLDRSRHARGDRGADPAERMAARRGDLRRQG